MSLTFWHLCLIQQTLEKSKDYAEGKFDKIKPDNKVQRMMF